MRINYTTNKHKNNQNDNIEDETTKKSTDVNY